MVPLRSLHPRAFTLIELTLVISVLLGLVSIGFIGVTAYKEGANRAICVQNAANAQKAMRSYSNFRGLEPGSPVPKLRSTIFAKDGFIPVEPKCPSRGEYTYANGTIPQIGTRFLTCSIPEHEPSEIAGW